LPPRFNEWGACLDTGATAAWHLGEPAFAPPYLAAALAHPDTDACACWSCAEQSGGRMAALLGDLPQAQRFFDQARRRFADDGRTPSLAICDHDEALALIRNGRPNDDAQVVALLDRAQTAFATLGMTPWLDRVAHLRGAAPDDLSPRELEVLRLLAQGRANKEIAAALFISVPTVERHVANIYAKTGARGRAAAAAYALRRGLLPA
jgi:DNA-binding CsgD family transcriptional regulator